MAMGANTHMRRDGKIDRTGWDNDPMAVEVTARHVIAGDYLDGHGLIRAILPEPDGSLLFCCGEDAVSVDPDAEAVICPAICEDCAQSPDDCFYYGCDSPDADA